MLRQLQCTTLQLHIKAAAARAHNEVHLCRAVLAEAQLLTVVLGNSKHAAQR